MRLGRFKEAEKNFKQVIFKDPDFAVAFANLGILYDTVDNYEQAIK